MAEKVGKVGVKKEGGYLYFVDKQGDVSRAKRMSIPFRFTSIHFDPYWGRARARKQQNTAPRKSVVFNRRRLLEIFRVSFVSRSVAANWPKSSVR